MSDALENAQSPATIELVLRLHHEHDKRFDVLEKRVDMLSTNLDNVAIQTALNTAAIQRIEDKIDRMHGHNILMENQINAILTILNEWMKPHQEKQETVITDHTVVLDKHGKRLDNHENRIDRMETV